MVFNSTISIFYTAFLSMMTNGAAVKDESAFELQFQMRKTTADLVAARAKERSQLALVQYLSQSIGRQQR
jgi:hypothetical protein